MMLQKASSPQCDMAQGAISGSGHWDSFVLNQAPATPAATDAQATPSWTVSASQKQCTNNDQRSFKGTGVSMDACKAFCLADANCGQIYGSLEKNGIIDG